MILKLDRIENLSNKLEDRSMKIIQIWQHRFICMKYTMIIEDEILRSNIHLNRNVELKKEWRNRNMWKIITKNF